VTVEANELTLANHSDQAPATLPAGGQHESIAIIFRRIAGHVVLPMQ
jgi:hypothetical protein